MVEEITVEELQRKLLSGEEFILLDVRREDERQFVNIGGTHIPLHELEHRWSELDGSKEILVYCRSGVRSAHAVEFLKLNGYERVKNVSGGILAWSARIDPTKPQY